MMRLYSKVVKMSYESFEKQFQWKTDPKTIKALEKMKKKEDAKKKSEELKALEMLVNNVFK